MATRVTSLPSAVADTAVERLAATVRGEVIQPGNPSYDTARRVYNGMINRHPRLVVRCVDVADVITAVHFAREHELVLAVRGGGHNAAGLGTCDDGVVIDLSRMRGVHVEAAGRVVRVEGGCIWADVDHATHAFGLATPSGIISSTGVGGLALGGGFGHLSRRYGLTCDNLLSADVVTADGRLVTASAEEHPDLFWGLRGGGGNFGIVTSFAFRLHPVSTVLGGPIFYPIERAGEVLRFFRDYIAEAPEEMSAFLGFHLAPPAPFVPEPLHEKPVVIIVACYSGPLDEGERLAKPLREIVPPAIDLLAPIPYPTLQSMFDALQPPGLQHYWKADFDRELSDEAIGVHLAYGPRVPSVPSLMHLYPLDGAVQRVGPTETAFSFRDGGFAHVVLATNADPEPMPAYMAWAREYWSALHPFSAGGAYVNFLMDEGEDRVRATYGENYPRLAALKATYDPMNLFRVNQNIRPEA